MTDSLEATRSSLLERLRDGPSDADWEEFVRRYGPSIYRWCTERGAPPADAEEVVQRLYVCLLRTLRTFKYDRSKGRFRDWLRTVTTNAWKDMIGEIMRHRGVGGSSTHDRVPDEKTVEGSVRPIRTVIGES